MKSAIVLAVLLMGLREFNALAEETPQKESKKVSVVQHFVPGSKPMKGESDSGGASVTELRPGPAKDSKSLFMQAWAGVGDSFPVHEKSTQLFDVTVKEGDDSHLVLEIKTKDATQKIEVKRDKRVEATVNGRTFSFLFPTLWVAADMGEKPMSPQAMIILNCDPEK